GTQSIIQSLAHLIIGYAEYYDYPDNLEEKPGILIIDEIDAHLHPSWQRRIIPTLTKHFPNLQIFCSTHSPLMLAGLKAGQVQLLKRDGNGKVTVSRNETDIVGWSADEILRTFLDVPNPTDLHTADQIHRLQELRQKEKLSSSEEGELEQLRHTVSQDLLGGPIAGQLEELSALLKQTRADLASQEPQAEKPRRRRKASSTPKSRRNADS
ncbi:MAG: AAA family ATPase, partial [Chloroflexi bacterium]|nr:AAA family ATPase [Chloroflexota bacterium]